MTAFDTVRVHGGDERSTAEELMLNLTVILERAKFDVDGEREHAMSFITKFSSYIKPAVSHQPVEAVAMRAVGGLAKWQTQKIKAHIDRHFDRKMPVGELSAYVQLSPSHFARAFKQTFGDTPHNYILRRRVACARQLLAATDMPLGQIALRCGFFDQAHLCKTFRQVTGEAPSTWRRQQRQNSGL